MTKKLYCNNRNNNKYLEVTHYDDGHYTIRQSMRWGNVVNILGNGLHCQGFTRVRKATVNELMGDYSEVMTYDV